MNEFIQAFAALLNGFPTIVLLFLAPIGGALMVTIVAALLGEIQTPGQFLGRVVVGTVTGWFCSSLVAPIVKSPPVTVGFLSGASGYWFMSKYLRKKQDEIMNKPPDDGQKPQ